MTGNNDKSDKLTGREAVTQSSQTAAKPAAPAAPAPAPAATAAPAPSSAAAPKPDPRDIGPLVKELNLTPDTTAENTVVVSTDQLLAVGAALKARGFNVLDCIGIDYLSYPEARPKRFSVLYNTYNYRDHRRLFVRVWLDDGEPCPSLCAVWTGANFIERETYDLLGIVFSGHPDLRKVLTPDDLEGHPLRKDFPLGETPTLFNEGRFLDPAAFRAGLTGQDSGLTGWRGSLRRGEQRDIQPPIMPEGGPK